MHNFIYVPIALYVPIARVEVLTAIYEVDFLQCRELGFEPLNTGGIEMSLHLEHMTLLRIKVGRVQGRGAGFVWAMLKR